MDLAMVGVIWQTNLVKAEITGAQKDLEDLVQRARSFANPKEEERKAAWTAGTEHRKSFSRDKRAAPLFLAAAGAGLILGNPIKNAACKALSIFDMCEDQSKLKNTVNGILKGQKQLEANLKRMADVANEKFFLLGTEIEQTQKSVEAVKNVMNENFQRTQNNILQIANAVKDINECQTRAADLHQFENELGNYATYLSAVFAHYKAFRASFYAYQTSLYSAIASLSSGFITPNILTPDQIRQVVDELTDEEVRRGTKLTPAIQVGYEATYYEVQVVLEVNVLDQGLSVLLGIPMNSKSSTFNVYKAMPLYQPNEDDAPASVFQFQYDFLAIATDNSRYAELSGATIQQCSGNNRIRLCRKGFSTTTDETLLCLTSLFYNYEVPAFRNCKVDTALLPDAPQAYYLADGIYHVISRNPTIQMKNDSHTHGVSINTLDCNACLIRPDCGSTITLNHGDLVLFPDMDICETRPDPFVASVKLTPALDNVFQALPAPSTTFNMYSYGAARESILHGVQRELAASPNIKQIDIQQLRDITRPIALHHSTISPAMASALSSYMPFRTASLFACISLCISITTGLVSFTLFRRQWKQFLTHPMKFIRGRHGQFIEVAHEEEHISDSAEATIELTRAEFNALRALAFELLQEKAAKACNSPSAPPESPLYPDLGM